MSTALFAPFLSDDSIIYGNASGTANVITKGDWVIGSGNWVIAANSGNAGFKASGMGVALANNPWYDELGVARTQTALPVLRHGIIRVSGMSAATVGTHAPVMTPVFPSTTSSGIVGQTGATGMGPVWVTAPLVNISSNPTGARPSGVARLLAVISYGSTGQWDVLLAPEDNGLI